ncbi:MAG: 30S ribosomal protein S16 [Deltaproteobacteria bacterium]|nr:30S ribosomal protein S16 [Deltaproteobacteria bacterium]
MAAAIRLTRVGQKKRPFYRVVVMDSRKKRDGAYIENLGTFDPIAKEGGIRLKIDRIQWWLERGARPSDRVSDLMNQSRL